MQYRREIDGLRAFAVIPVILFHAGFSQFSGGFVGVDVFFVISGYLITTIILSEKEAGTFSLANFYERRARRIIPALFLVLFSSSLLAWLWLPPTHMKDFSQSLVAVSLFSSNILFWQETGYWGVANELKPLLHTWSLAVEEQYYVFFPLFLMAMWRFRKRWILSSFFIVAIASLLLSQWAAFNEPSGNFFLLPTRGWELAIGAGIAFYFLYRKNIIDSLRFHTIIAELFSSLGLGLIVYAVCFFDENTPFPSIYALVPTIGTALVIIFSTKDTFTGKLLGSKIFVGLGLISYSAYLWHQPLFAFARHRSLHEPSSLLLVFLAIASLLIAFISWKYVEAPFRKKNTISRSQIFSLTIIGSIGFILFGLGGHATDGYKNRFDSGFINLLSAATKTSYSSDLCEKIGASEVHKINYCVLVDRTKNSVFLYGDSHARSLSHQAKVAFKKTELGLIYIDNYACPPIENIERLDSGLDRKCPKQADIYNFVKQTPEIEYVILIARWAIWMEGSLFDNGEGGIEGGATPVLRVNGNASYVHGDGNQNREPIAQNIDGTIDGLLDAGKKVILIYPVPESGWNVPDYLARNYFINPDSALHVATASTSHDIFRKRNQRSINTLDNIGQHENLIRVLPEDIFCDNDIPGRCVTQKDGAIFYQDDDHLSEEGAKVIVERIIEQLDATL